jgi:hypothetical protein
MVLLTKSVDSISIGYTYLRRLVFDVEVWAEVEGVGAVPAEVQFLQAWQ